MNQSAIFYLLAYFYVSYAPTQADLAKQRRVKAGTVWKGDTSAHFSTGKVYLYKVTNEPRVQDYYVFRDEERPRKDCPEFPLNPDSAIVTTESVQVMYGSTMATIILDDKEDTFEFYQSFYPFGKFSRKYKKINVSIDGKQLSSGAVIKAKQVEHIDEWCFVIFDGDSPRIIFPQRSIKLQPKNASNTRKVEIFIDRTPDSEKTFIAVQFDSSTKADEFRDLLESFGAIFKDLTPPCVSHE